MSFFFFFFKQKTAYEIGHCDCSSDVFSSDLAKPAKSGNATADSDGAGTAKRDANFENKRKMSYKEKREYEQLTDRKSVV